MNAKYRITINMTEAEYAALSALADRVQVLIAWLSRSELGEIVEKNKNDNQLSLPFDHSNVGAKS
jgi:hypothetical protein